MMETEFRVGADIAKNFEETREIMVKQANERAAKEFQANLQSQLEREQADVVKHNQKFRELHARAMAGERVSPSKLAEAQQEVAWRTHRAMMNTGDILAKAAQEASASQNPMAEQVTQQFTQRFMAGMQQMAQSGADLAAQRAADLEADPNFGRGPGMTDTEVGAGADPFGGMNPRTTDEAERNRPRGPIDAQDEAGEGPEEAARLRRESPKSMTSDEAGHLSDGEFYAYLEDKGLPNPGRMSDQEIVDEMRTQFDPKGRVAYDENLVADALQREIEKRDIELPDFRYEKYLEDKGLPVPSKLTDDELVTEAIYLRDVKVDDTRGPAYGAQLLKAVEREAKRRGLEIPEDYDDEGYRAWLREQEID